MNNLTKFISCIILLAVSWNTYSRDLSFLTSPKSKVITIGEKKFGEFTDKIFVDGLGRETYFRGWNTGNAPKHPPYLPEKLRGFEHYKAMLKEQKKRTGSNVLRWIIPWEAIHPQVDVIDYALLRTTVKYWKYAMSLGYYILIDLHQDLFTELKGGGGGAPKWVAEGMNLPEGNCKTLYLPCLSWSMGYFTNRAVKQSLRNFWDNKWLDTTQGKRKPQDEYIWMLRRALNYWKDHLTKDEFKMIIGLDPFNEPADGGLQYYKGMSAAEWSENLLWPFYRNIRKMMDNNGWYHTPLFAEPNMNWNVNLPLIRPRGEGFLIDIPKRGYVFNAHMYDETREGIDFLGRLIRNGTYLKEMDRFRNEGRYLGQPPFCSEYGAWGNTKIFDSNRMLKAIYQGLEISMTSKKRRNRFSDFYSPLIGGTQWSWSLENGWPSKEYEEGYIDMFDQRVIERAYPKRVQGDIMTFFYDDIANTTYKPEKMKWACLRLKDKCLFKDEKFIWLVWRGRKSDAPTEVFLPRHFNLDKLLLITEKKIKYGISGKFIPTGEANEFFLKPGVEGDSDSGHRLFIYDDHDNKEDKDSFHFLTIGMIDEAKLPSPDALKRMQMLLRKKLILKKSPLFLLGKVKIDRPKKAFPHAK